MVVVVGVIVASIIPIGGVLMCMSYSLDVTHSLQR